MSDGSGRGGTPDRPSLASPATPPGAAAAGQAAEPGESADQDRGEDPPCPADMSYPADLPAQYELGQPVQAGRPHGPPGTPGPRLSGGRSWTNGIAGVARSRLLVATLVTAVLSALVGGVVGGYVGSRSAGGAERTYSLGTVPPALNSRPPDSLAGIAARVLPSVVMIKVNGAEGTGSGFVIRGGYIVTDNHVITLDGQVTHASLQVVLDGDQAEPAQVVGADPYSDIAVIRLQSPVRLPALSLGNSGGVKVGDPVMAFGSPLGLAGTVTSGIVSALNRPVQPGMGDGGTASQVFYDAIQTDAPINPGNSGGPLVNAQGQVIGVNSAIDTLGADPVTGTQGGSIGLGFAIPINRARLVATELIQTGRAAHAVIGAVISATYHGNGAQIARARATGAQPVTPGGPAALGGLRPGDVIIRFAGQPIGNGTTLLDAIRSQQPGARVAVTFIRDGVTHTVTLTLGSAESLGTRPLLSRWSTEAPLARQPGAHGLLHDAY
jgi:S1-C subfamily serine protease